MSFVEEILEKPRPAHLSEIHFPHRENYYASPVDWRNEVLYFLLPDRFSDSREVNRPLLDRQNLSAARPVVSRNEGWRWDKWFISGSQRWQGGNLPGITSKLAYLKDLGITTIWIGPVFKQRGHLNTYHGYGIQDFLEVDPHFGSRADLVQLVAEAHRYGIRVILDIVFNHSGSNWIYPDNLPGGPYTPVYTTGQYPFGAWRGADGQPISDISSGDEGVWPEELQHSEEYTRAGSGNLGSDGDLFDVNAEYRRTDFGDLRDFLLSAPDVLNNLVNCYKYWIALTDCDGFRIDTLKHVSLEQARNFCGAIKEYAANLGKANFFLVGEIAGGDYNEERYLTTLALNLSAALDIGEMCPILNGVARGLANPGNLFGGFNTWQDQMGSHRNLGNRHVSILDDHDHVMGEKLRFSANATSDYQVAAGVALQLFTLGIPCIYYGTEQALGGPEVSERQWLPDWGRQDAYLREAMFGPEHPHRSGRAGVGNGARELLDPDLPGFGPFGTAGQHCFDQKHPAYLRIAALIALRKAYPVLRYGRQYQRQMAAANQPFSFYGAGSLIAWSRILDEIEALCVINGHGTEPQGRGIQIIVDSTLNPASGYLQVVLNTTQAANPRTYTGPLAVGIMIPVQRRSDGAAYVELPNLPPAETVVLLNHP